MSTVVPVVINGQEYIAETENGVVIKLKRFNENYGFWIELHFSELELKADQELLKILSAEFVRQTFL